LGSADPSAHSFRDSFTSEDSVATPLRTVNAG
jgi:hypothetical protein